MAFGGDTSLGATGSTNNNQTTLDLATVAAINAGDFVLVVVAADNIANGGDDGAVTGVTLGVGGQSLLKAKQQANALAAQAGASCSVWYGVATSSLASGGTIRATFGSGTLVDASGLTARKFTIGAGKTVAIEGTPGQLVNDTGADPGSLNVTTTNMPCLRVRGIASQVGNNTNLTPTSTWTAWANGNSATTGTTGEMCARAEHIISTGTGAASDPTYVSAIYSSVYVAFKEVATVAAGLLTAVNTAQPVTALKAKAIGLLSETAVALAVVASLGAAGAGISRGIPNPVELPDWPLPQRPARIAPLIPPQVDVPPGAPIPRFVEQQRQWMPQRPAQIAAIIPQAATNVAVGVATEADSAPPVTARKTITIGIPPEAEIALPVTRLAVAYDPPGVRVPWPVELPDPPLPQRPAKIAAIISTAIAPPTIDNPPFGNRRLAGWAQGAPVITAIYRGGLIISGGDVPPGALVPRFVERKPDAWPQRPARIAPILAPAPPPVVIDDPPGARTPNIVELADPPIQQRRALLAAILAQPPVVNNPPFGKNRRLKGWREGPAKVTAVYHGGLITNVDNPPIGNRPRSIAVNMIAVWAAYPPVPPPQRPAHIAPLIPPPPVISNPPGALVPRFVERKPDAWPQRPARIAPLLKPAPRTIAVGLPTETDVAPAVNKAGARAIGLVIEVDTAPAVSKAKRKAVGLASETDSTFAVKKLKRVTLGLNSETDTAQAVTKAKRKTVGLTTSANTAFPVSKRRTKAAGLATETDSTFAVSKNFTGVVGQAQESDEARPVARIKSKAIGRPIEADSTFAVKHKRTKLVGFALETDTAPPIRDHRHVRIGFASEFDQSFAVSKSKRKAVKLATETDSARLVGKRRTKSIGFASEADSAFAVTHRHAWRIGVATEVDASQPLGRASKVKHLGFAAEVDSAVKVKAKLRRVWTARATVFAYGSNSEMRVTAAGGTIEIRYAFGEVIVRVHEV